MAELPSGIPEISLPGFSEQSHCRVNPESPLTLYQEMFLKVLLLPLPWQRISAPEVDVSRDRYWQYSGRAGERVRL